ncbi:MAG: hypothetical protein MZW92_09550 [Comamonadaceae bacterium]|nr:hypothetical protein [Comamonadaceae bacterium]
MLPVFSAAALADTRDRRPAGLVRVVPRIVVDGLEKYQFGGAVGRGRAGLVFPARRSARPGACRQLRRCAARGRGLLRQVRRLPRGRRAEADAGHIGHVYLVLNYERGPLYAALSGLRVQEHASHVTEFRDRLDGRGGIPAAVAVDTQTATVGARRLGVAKSGCRTASGSRTAMKCAK